MSTWWYRIHVRVDGKLVDCGKCDRDHISMISLLKVLRDNDLLTSKTHIITDEHNIFVELPWNSERLSISSDAEMIRLFQLFEKREVKNIIFVVEKKGNGDVPNPVPIGIEGELQKVMFEEPEVGESSEDDETNESQYERLRREFPFLYDNGEGEGAFDAGKEGVHDDVGEDANGGVVGQDAIGGAVGGDVGERAVGRDVCGRAVGGDTGGESLGGDVSRGAVGGDAGGGAVGGDTLHLFEGYQSNDDDDFFTARYEDDNTESTMAKRMEGLPYVQGIGGEIRFHVKQTHESVYTLREVLRDYAIKEGITFIREKNDRDRLRYKCAGVDCP